MSQNELSHLASVDFLVNWGDSTSKNEIESELLRIILQVKDTIPYDRDGGGNFSNLEQEKNQPDLLRIELARDIVFSVYQLNVAKGFKPFIVVGFADVEVTQDLSAGADSDFIVLVRYRVLQDLTVKGTLRVT